jgi:hypothetical protein
MNAVVLVLGPFRPSLVPLLTHPPEHYRGVREGAVILERLCEPAVGSSTSRALAEALGVEPWDFNSHPLDPYAVDLARLADAVGAYVRDEPAEAVVRRFVALRDAGFQFHFRPEG